MPTAPDPEVNGLTCAVVPLPDAEFYHFGTNRQMIESTSAVQNLVLDETKLGRSGARQHPDQVPQNTRFDVPLRREHNHMLGSRTAWSRRAGPGLEHVLTGVPENTWSLRLEPGVCLDFVPVGDDQFCVRAYGIDDAFSGALDDAATRWLGRPARQWFAARGLRLEDAALIPRSDLQACRPFPVLARDGAGRGVHRMVICAERPRPERRARTPLAWRPRLSAQAIGEQVNLAGCTGNARGCARPPSCRCSRNRWSVFFRLDLESAARAFAAGATPCRSCASATMTNRCSVHDQMFRSAVLRHRAGARLGAASRPAPSPGFAR